MKTLEAFFNALCIASEHGCITTANIEDRPESEGGWKSLLTTLFELTDQRSRLSIVHSSANVNPALKAELSIPLFLIYAQRDESVFELQNDPWETLADYLDVIDSGELGNPLVFTPETCTQIINKAKAEASETFKVFDIKEAQFEGYLVLCLDI